MRKTWKNCQNLVLFDEIQLTDASSHSVLDFKLVIKSICAKKDWNCGNFNFLSSNSFYDNGSP